MRAIICILLILNFLNNFTPAWSSGSHDYDDCPPGYSHQRCKDTYNRNECTSNPCRRGTCQNLWDAYECTCPLGFGGENCQNDIQKPSIVCPPNQVIELNDSNTEAVYWDAPVVTDNSGDARVTVDHDSRHRSGNMFLEGETVVQYVATDQAGNTNTCSFSIHLGRAGQCDTDVSPCQNGATCDQKLFDITCFCRRGFEGDRCEHDTEDPRIFCPPNQVIELATDSNTEAVYWDEPVVSDNAGDALVTVDHDSWHRSGNMFLEGETVVQYVATDQAGNTNTCSFSIHLGRGGQCDISPCQNGATCEQKLFDITCFCMRGFEGDRCEHDVKKPDIICPDEVFVETSSLGGAIVTWHEPIVSDNSGITLTHLTSSHQSGDVFPIGSTAVTVSVADDAQNINSCSFKVTVRLVGQCDISPCQNGATCEQKLFGITCFCRRGFEGDRCEHDVKKPDIICPDEVFVETSSLSGAIVTWHEPTVSDNSGITLTHLTSSHQSGDVFPIGSTAVTVSVADDAQNINSCSFKVTVRHEIVLSLKDSSDDHSDDPNPIFTIGIPVLLCFLVLVAVMAFFLIRRHRCNPVPPPMSDSTEHVYERPL